MGSPRKFIKHYDSNFDLIYDNYIYSNKVSGVENVRSIELINIDKENTNIEFVYYDGYQTLRNRINDLIRKRKFMIEKDAIATTLYNIGVFIAKYHSEQGKRDTVRHNFKHIQNNDFQGIHCFLHGDLTDNNIVVNSNNETVIIDWEPTPVVKSFFNFGNPLWDICWFINALLKPSPGTYFYTSKRVELVKSFTDGYRSVSELNTGLVYEYFKENIANLINNIYNNSSIVNSIIKRKHLNNWEQLSLEIS